MLGTDFEASSPHSRRHFAGRPPAVPWDGRRLAVTLVAARGAGLSGRSHVNGHAPRCRP